MVRDKNDASADTDEDTDSDKDEATFKSDLV